MGGRRLGGQLVGRSVSRLFSFDEPTQAFSPRPPLCVSPRPQYATPCRFAESSSRKQKSAAE